MENLEKDLLKDKKFCVWVDKDFYNKVRDYCIKNDYQISQLIRVLLKKHINGKMKL